MCKYGEVAIVAIHKRYILSKSIMAATLRAASHTCVRQTMHSILLIHLFILHPLQSKDVKRKKIIEIYIARGKLKEFYGK